MTSSSGGNGTAFRRPISAKDRQRKLIATAVMGLLMAVATVAAALRLAADPDVQANLGDEVFRVGDATRMARRVAADGPLLFQDLLQRDRDIYVNHVAADPTEGWVAFEAHAPGAPRRCQLLWEPSARRFRDPCGGTTYPADGRGLTRYRASVDAGQLVVDLRPAASDSRS